MSGLSEWIARVTYYAAVAGLFLAFWAMALALLVAGLFGVYHLVVWAIP